MRNLTLILFSLLLPVSANAFTAHRVELPSKTNHYKISAKDTIYLQEFHTYLAGTWQYVSVSDLPHPENWYPELFRIWSQRNYNRFYWNNPLVVSIDQETGDRAFHWPLKTRLYSLVKVSGSKGTSKNTWEAVFTLVIDGKNEVTERPVPLVYRYQFKNSDEFPPESAQIKTLKNLYSVFGMANDPEFQYIKVMLKLNARSLAALKTHRKFLKHK